jgi:hypothetical protein
MLTAHVRPTFFAEWLDWYWGTDGLANKGFPPHLVQHRGAVVQDYRDGIFAGTNDFAETIGSKTPMTVGHPPVPYLALETRVTRAVSRRNLRGSQAPRSS